MQNNLYIQTEIVFNLKFRLAHLSDVPVIVELLNLAYRQQDGNSWTSESKIVLGDRINLQQLEQSLVQDDFQLFVAELDQKIVACIGLTFSESDVEVGTFAIAPYYQNQGLGRQILDFAENHVHKSIQYKKLKYFVMWVLSVRYELIAYYERRGYVQTGVINDYPLDANVGTPIVDLHLVEMRKMISKIKI